MQASVNPSLLTFHKVIYFLILVYADDMLVVGSSSPYLIALNCYLGICFCVKHLDSFKCFEGIEVTQIHSRLFLS